MRDVCCDEVQTYAYRRGIDRQLTVGVSLLPVAVAESMHGHGSKAKSFYMNRFVTVSYFFGSKILEHFELASFWLV